MVCMRLGAEPAVLALAENSPRDCFFTRGKIYVLEMLLVLSLGKSVPGTLLFVPGTVHTSCEFFLCMDHAAARVCCARLWLKTFAAGAVAAKHLNFPPP